MYQCFQIAWRRLEVKCGANSCIGISYLYQLYIIYTDTKIQISTKLERKFLTKSFCQEKQVMYLSLLPPCQSTLYMHILHSNYVAKSYLLDMVKCPDIMEKVWIENSEIVWVDDPFPDDQKQLPRGVSGKSCSENMQQIYRRTSMPKCNFNKVAKQLY